MSYLLENPKDRFFRDMAHISIAYLQSSCVRERFSICGQIVTFVNVITSYDVMSKCVTKPCIKFRC